MSEKKGFWEGWFGKKEPKSDTSQTENNTTTQSEPQGANKSYIPSEQEKQEALKHAQRIAESLIDNIWESEYLKPNEKYKSIDDYLKKELYIEFDKDIYEKPDEFEKIDKLIRYNWQERLKAQAKKFGTKTGISAGATLVIGGITGIFSGGLSIIPSLVAFAGSTGARGIFEAIRGVNGIWGKEKSMNIEIAKDYIYYSLEAQRLAKELQETTNTLGSNPEDAILNNKQIEISEKLINLIYDNEKKPVNERLINIVTKKEEMTKYQEKWNIAEEIVSFVGGVGAGVAYSLTKGVESLANQKLSQAATGKLEINLDGDKINHFVKKIGDGWHYIIKDIDISNAIAKSGENWTNWFHQLGGETAKTGGLHIQTLSEEAIKKYLSTEAVKEMWFKGISSLIGVSAGNTISSYFTERKLLEQQYGTPTLEELADKEILKEKYSKTLNVMLEQSDSKIKEEKEVEIHPSKEWIKNAKVGDVFMYENPTDKRKIRIEVIEIKDKKIYFKFIDKKLDGKSYKPIKDWFEIGESSHNFIDKWSDRKKYSYDQWQDIERFLDENIDKIEKLQKDKDIVFRKNADLASLKLNDKMVYRIYKIDKKTNKVYLYEKDKGYKSDKLIIKEMDKIIGLIDFDSKKRESDTEEATGEKKETKFVVNDMVEFVGYNNKTKTEFQSKGKIVKIEGDKYVILYTSSTGNSWLAKVKENKIIGKI